MSVASTKKFGWVRQDTQWFIEGLSFPWSLKIKVIGPDALIFSTVSERTGSDRSGHASEVALPTQVH